MLIETDRGAGRRPDSGGAAAVAPRRQLIAENFADLIWLAGGR